MARTFEKFHNTLNTSALFDLLSDLFQKNYTVGCEVANHAYSVLGVYEIKTDNGTNVSLVRYFNPLHAEVWKANPWGDESANWTNSVKKQVPYKNGNDGIVFSTIEDYQANFTLTNWAEIHDDYDVNFIDLAFNYDDTSSHHFEVNFTYYGDAGKDVYIFNDQNDGKSLIGCSASVTISKFVVYSQNKTVFKSNPGNIVKIANAQPGIYKASFSMKKNIKVVKSFTMTAYCQEGNVNFIPPKKNIINYLQKKQCPNNCNFHGSCNTFDGTCRCYFGVISFSKLSLLLFGSMKELIVEILEIQYVRIALNLAYVTKFSVKNNPKIPKKQNNQIILILRHMSISRII